MPLRSGPHHVVGVGNLIPPIDWMKMITTAWTVCFFIDDIDIWGMDK